MPYGMPIQKSELSDVLVGQLSKLSLSFSCIFIHKFWSRQYYCRWRRQTRGV